MLTDRRITVRAGTGAVDHLSYSVPIIGTEKANRSFLIECDLPDSTSMLHQKEYVLLITFSND